MSKITIKTKSIKLQSCRERTKKTAGFLKLSAGERYWCYDFLESAATQRCIACPIYSGTVNTLQNGMCTSLHHFRAELLGGNFLSILRDDRGVRNSGVLP